MRAVIVARGSPPALHGDSRTRRAVDLVVALLGLLVALPALLGLGLAVRLTSRGPALFHQERVGRGARPFRIVKFRTMAVGAETRGALVSGAADPRVTRIGAALRRTRLDELPQLVNVLRGELTLFGPRPEVPRFIAHYRPEERELLRVRPGIIGPGAVLFAESQSGELDAVTDPESHYVAHHLHPRLALDLDYLAHRSLRRDLALLVGACGVVLGR